MKLSQRRAATVAKYLKEHGIAANRMVVKAYGETHLLSHCPDGIICDEAAHAMNRRVELKVISRK